MIKKIICDFEDVKDFQKFYYEGDAYIKVPLLEHKIQVPPVPWDMRSIVDYKMNCYQLEKRHPIYDYIENGSEVEIYPSESEIKE